MADRIIGQKTMLTAFTLANFKSYREETRLPLAPLTVLIGANASGKSNLVEGLRLLSWLAKGQRLSSIQHTINSAEQIIRGRVADLFYSEQNSFSLGCQIGQDSWETLKIEIGLHDDRLQIIHEYYSDLETRKIVPLKAKSPVFNDLSFFAAAAIVGKGEWPFPEYENTRQLFEDYQSKLSNILFLDPIPARMRTYSFPSDDMVEDGTNLSSALYTLCASDASKGFKNQEKNRRFILDVIQSLPEQVIDDINFLHGPRGEVMLQLVETFGGIRRNYDASLLSDGTLRVLAIAAAMLSAPSGGLVVIEEIDNGVHPSRAHHLLKKIRAVAEERGLRVLLSTHNPAMLDALPDSAVPDVVFCYRDPASGSSQLIRMQDIPDVPELLAQGTLGHLMTNGMLDRFVKNHPGPEERKQQARAWLNTLKTSDAEETPQ